MNDVVIRRRVAEATQRLVFNTKDSDELQNLVAVLDALGDLVSAWTGESVRIRMIVARGGKAVATESKAETEAETPQYLDMPAFLRRGND